MALLPVLNAQCDDPLVHRTLKLGPMRQVSLVVQRSFVPLKRID